MFTQVLFFSIREYLEVFLIISLFLGLITKLNPTKTKEIILASSVGVILSLLLPILGFWFGDSIKSLISEENEPLFAGAMMTISSIFIVYVVFALHDLMVQGKKTIIRDAKDKLKEGIFDLSLSLMVITLILREGVEVALFTLSSSVNDSFLSNILALFAGFLVSAVIGVFVYLGSSKLPIARAFQFTEWLLVVIGGAMFSNGISELLESLAKIELKEIATIQTFLPDSDTIIGTFFKTTFALRAETGLIQILLNLGYIVTVYWFFLRKKA
jgi:high-affinity iron transporter